MAPHSTLGGCLLLPASLGHLWSGQSPCSNAASVHVPVLGSTPRAWEPSPCRPQTMFLAHPARRG